MMGALPLLICLAAAEGPTGTQTGPIATPELSVLLRRYFAAESTAEDRVRLVGQIEAAAGGDAERVAAELPAGLLWPDAPRGEFAITGPGGTGLRVRCDLTAEYDPARAYPLVFCVPAAASGREATTGAARVALQLPAGEAVICTADRELPDRNGTASQVRAALAAIRQEVHVDPDRTYLFGAQRGADNAWLIALSQPDLFAGAVLIGGYPPWPYADLAYAFLLPNLDHLPALSVWADDHPVNARAQGRPAIVAAHNRAIAAYASRLQLPITSVPVPASTLAQDTLVLSNSAAVELLKASRPPSFRRVSHWFRYPDQGQSGWLRLVEFRGEVWEQEQIDILPDASVDREKFITQILQDRLGYLGGTIADNVIDITTRRAARIEVLLTPELVDFSRPVRITCNGIKRFDGPVTPSIPLMLESVRETWDFQRPVWARLTFNIQADGQPD